MIYRGGSKGSRYYELLALCQRRHSTRAFLDQPLTAEQINKIKSVAMTSPYASGKKNWEIIVITEKDTIAQMAQAVDTRVNIIATEIHQDYSDGFRNYAKNFVTFAAAPALFIPAYRSKPLLSMMLNNNNNEIEIFERDNYVKSISCVSMLVLLAAESLGLGACYMTGPLLAEKSLSPFINLKPGYSIGALIPVGYAK